MPSQDIVLGLYYMTRERTFAKGEYPHGKAEDAKKSDKGDVKAEKIPANKLQGVFSSPEEVRLAYDHGELDLQAAIRVRFAGEIVASTTGRVLLYEIVPKQLPFKIVNRVMGKKQLGDLIDSCYRACGQKETVLLADKLRSLGYAHSTKAGISICVDDHARSRRARSSCSRRRRRRSRRSRSSTPRVSSPTASATTRSSTSGRRSRSRSPRR